MDNRDWYLQTWELVLTHLLGWSAPQIRNWAKSWDLSNSTFYHELPTYYLAGLLIPADLTPRTCNYWPLVSEVMRALGNPTSDGTYDWEAARKRVDAVITNARKSLVEQ